jgi:hypothetical protein
MPGHGASHADFENKIIAGNTFDFVSVHGNTLKELGFSFASSSDEALEDKSINLNNYKFIDLILGEEKSTKWVRPEFDSTKGVQFKTFSKELQNVLKDYLFNGGNLFLSGAHIASDMIQTSKDKNDIVFIKEILKFDLASPSASKTGIVKSIRDEMSALSLEFNTKFNDKIYSVESPDGLIPINGSRSIFRYSENQIDAGIFYKKDYGIIALGFPFETIIGSEKRLELMKRILELLDLK